MTNLATDTFPASDDAAEPTNALMTPEHIGEICEGRDMAIARWKGIYATYHAEREKAARECIGGILHLAPPRDDYGNAELSRAFLATAPDRRRDRERGEMIETPAADHFEAVLTKEIDRQCWTALMERLGFDDLLDEQARREFSDGLRENPTPFTVENCTATFGHIWANRRDLYLRGIANVFMKLDRRFRSHDGFKIGSRLIINRALNAWGSWDNYERKYTLRDVERVFYELDGEPLPTMTVKRPGSNTPLEEADEGQRIDSLITGNGQSRETPRVVHCRYFRVRIFGNGNLHIWFERKDLLEQVNKLLAEYYGEVIGDGYDTTEADDAPQFHMTPAKDFGAFMSSEAVAARVMNHASINKGERVLEPNAGTGILAKAARDHGADVTCIEIQPGMAHELRVLHGFQSVLQGDFLRTDPAQFELFDVIVMNPPFDRGRDCDHVTHALKFLRPGGRLIAVMSARAEYGEDKRHKAFHRIIDQCRPCYGNGKWWDLPPGSFAHAGTNVNTVVLAIRKPD
jgi:predicted RNA methylase|tara:strand:- start:1554 stop:3101 length:1548 start_codon:yes stop_codon:yes gene_type:complete